MTKLYVIDTNILLDTPEIIGENKCVILSHVIRELEKHKLSADKELAYKARNATRYIENNIKDVMLDFSDYHVQFDSNVDSQYVDNKIIQACISNDFGIITNDLLLKHKASGYGIEVLDVRKSEDEYNGYLEVVLEDEEIAHFYEKLDVNTYNLLVNQYIIIRNKKNEIIESARWTGEEFKLVSQKGFTTNMFGKFKPFDVYQSCLLDSLNNNQLTMVKGKAGTGKSLIALNFAWQQLEKGRYDKLIIFSNPVNSKNSSRLGFYPGTRTEKLMDSAVGSMLISKFGDQATVEMLINNGKIMLLPFADIRGFDSTGMKAIIWIVESQNLDVELMKLGLQRIGEDSKAILDGDYYGQVDMDVYSGGNNGMRRVSEVFKGEKLYGEVMLPIIHRSELAEIADRM